MEFDTPPSYIYLNKSLWFDFRGNKVVFGGDFLKNKNHHLTLPLGLHTGYMDLHLTSNGKHYPICHISLFDLLKVIPIFLSNLNKSIYKNLEPFDYKLFINKKYAVRILQGGHKSYDDKFEEIVKRGLESLRATPTSKKIRINNDDPRLEKIKKDIGDNQPTIYSTIEELEKMSSVFALIEFESDSGALFVMKNEFTGNNLYSFTNFNLDTRKILADVFGEQLIQIIEDKIKDYQNKLETGGLNHSSEMEEGYRIRIAVED